MFRRLALVLAMCLFVVGSSAVDAKSSGSKRSKRPAATGQKTAHGKTAHWKTYTRKNGTKSTARGAARGENRHITRSAAARHAFMRQTGYPRGRPGYVVDHIKPLACGGADAPSNMEWQTIAEAKAKDRIERVGCR